ncbi:uncharacterized protein LOC106528902 [Austrofundulus limnaeus]|uniref:Uncharacterized protein LOC106528902 n=1 Tax=Austrofundulus limnaeus TaxID=52670 RepID=A0A2I4CI18_AUSLI|nr:PREDICTED: uncharacterized protein LOC106528902 [Austrofundulus limnaeus]
MSGYVVVRPVRKANGNSVVSMLDYTCACLGIPRELRTDNGTHFRNVQVNRWCEQYGVMRVYSPPYTPQANGVAERTIGLVKSWLAKNANSKEWSLKTVEIGRALNDREREGRPSPSDELNQHPFVTEELGRSQEVDPASTEACPFSVGQKVWLKARDQPSTSAVKPKYDEVDSVIKVLDQNTVLLKKKGIQGVEQLKPALG